MDAISVNCINIECDRHLTKVWEFLSKQQADVILLQEIFREDVAEFEKRLNMHSKFTGVCHLRCDRGTLEMGIAIFSKLPITNSNIVYYRGSANNLPCIDNTEPEKMARALLISEVSVGGLQYCIINTHFTWSPNGIPSEKQFIDYKAMMQILDSIPEFVLCGDFNAPRGTAIFDLLAANFKDNMPADIKTTLDRNLHKVGHRDLLVDGIFTTPKYQVHKVNVTSGVSDHCAITFNVQKL